MLIAIESSCIPISNPQAARSTESLILVHSSKNLRHSERRKRRLSQTDPAIIRRNRVIRPDLQRLALQQYFQIAQQQFVLKHAAGKHDGVGIVRRTQIRAASQRQQQFPGETPAQSHAHPDHAADREALRAASDENPVHPAQTGTRIPPRSADLRANCSSHIAACPSKLVSRVNPTNAATVSNSRPIDVVANVRIFFRTSCSASRYRAGKRKGAAVKSGNSCQLLEKTGRRLHRIRRRRVATRQGRATQMRHAFESLRARSPQKFLRPRSFRHRRSRYRQSSRRPRADPMPPRSASTDAMCAR